MSGTHLVVSFGGLAGLGVERTSFALWSTEDVEKSVKDTTHDGSTKLGSVDEKSKGHSSEV